MIAIIRDIYMSCGISQRLPGKYVVNLYIIFDDIKIISCMNSSELYRDFNENISAWCYYRQVSNIRRNLVGK